MTNSVAATDDGAFVFTAPVTQAIDDIVRQYQAGYSIRTVATLVGFSYGTVNRVLRSRQVQMRPRGGASRQPRRQAIGRVPPPRRRRSTST